MTTHCKPSKVICWPYCCAPHGDVGIKALAAFGRRIREREQRRPENAIDLTGLEVARMIGSNSLKVAGDGIAMFEGSGGILEYIAKKHPRSEVRVMAVRYLLKMIRELSGDEYSTRKELLMQNANTIENSGKEYERDEAVSKMMWVMHKASNTGHGPITRAPEWYAGGDYIEKPMETRENGPDSEFVIGLAGRLGWSEYSDGHKYGMVLKKRTGAVEW